MKTGGQEVVGGIPPDAKNATVGSRYSCLGGKSCREGVSNIPDMKNATTGSRSSCLGGRGWWEGCRDIPDTKTRHWVRVFVSGVWKTIPDTKNATPGSH